ncbi:MAG: phage recombination protein Bet [Psychroflexus sp.]
MNQVSIHETEWSEKKIQLLKDNLCKEASDDEFEIFFQACKQTGLNPFMKQIYMVKRWNSDLKRNAMTFQTGIDGYRLIAERSGKYAPGRSSEYRYDDKGNLISAIAYVKKQTTDGTWHEVAAEAFYSEYVAKKKDGEPTGMWKEKPHIMLGKCAEALALRKAFPAELSGVYTKEEMEQADNPKEIKEEPKQIEIGYDEFEEITALLNQLPEYKEQVESFVEKKGWGGIAHMPKDTFKVIKANALKRISKDDMEVENGTGQ